MKQNVLLILMAAIALLEGCAKSTYTAASPQKATDELRVVQNGSVSALTKPANTVPTKPPKGYTLDKPEEFTPPLTFVSEYISELAQDDDRRVEALQEIASVHGNAAEIIMSGIHAATRAQLELQEATATLGAMRLEPNSWGEEQLIPQLLQAYALEISLQGQVIADGKTVLSAHNAVDVGKMQADLPQLRARLDGIERLLFKQSGYVFHTLVQPSEETKLHPNRLIITRADRAELVKQITIDFGSRLTRKPLSYRAETAALFKESLLQYKCVDDPLRTASLR